MALVDESMGYSQDLPSKEPAGFKIIYCIEYSRGMMRYVYHLTLYYSVSLPSEPIAPRIFVAKDTHGR